jgi:tetratricopeptide (TPR) repeat protein
MRYACHLRLILGWSAIILAATSGLAQGRPPGAGKAIGSVRNWDVATGHTVSASDTVPHVASYSWSADGSVRAAGEGAAIQITNREHDVFSLAIRTNYGQITALTLNRAGDELAVGTSSGYLLVWTDLRAATPAYTAGASSSEISCVAFNVSGERIVTGGRSLDVWQTKGLKPARPSLAAASWITTVAFGPADELAAGDFSGHLHIFNSSGESTADILEASGSVTAVAYSTDGSLMAGAGTDGVVKLWGANRNAPLAVLTEQSRVLALSFHANNAILAVATDENQISTWDIASRRRLRTLPLGNVSVAGIAFTSNDLLCIGLQAAPPPRVATLHILVLLGGPKSSGENADVARADAIAVADAVQKAGRGSFGRIDQQRLPIDSGLDANAVRDAFQSIARDSHPEDSLFVYYAGPTVQEVTQTSHPLVFANGGTVTLIQVAHWLDDVAATAQTIVFDAAGAPAQQSALRNILTSGPQKHSAQEQKRLFVAFDRLATQEHPGGRSDSTAMLIDGLSGQADQIPKDGRVTADELRIFLDQRTLSIAASGFKGKYELEGNDFELVAQKLTRGIVMEPEPGPAHSANLFQKRHDYALLIATDDYDSWPKLGNPVGDAEAVKSVLEKSYGFTVELLENPRQQEIYEALQRYQKKDYQPGDQLLIFMAGHGDFDDDAKEGFVVAKDSKLPGADPTRNSFVPHSRLRSYIDNIPVNHVLLIMDVCFGGTFDRGIADPGGARGGMYEDQPVEKLFVERDQYPTRKFITSGGKVYVPDGELGHNSPFVHSLLTELRNPSKERGYLTFADLLSAVGSTTPAPVWGTWGKDGAGSDFFLISHGAANIPARPADPKPHTPDVVSVVERRRIVCLVGLRNASGDLSAGVWGDAIAEQVTGGLGAGQRLSVTSSEDVGRLKRNLALEDLSSYSKETLFKIRQNTGADLVIAGSFLAAKEAGGLLRVSFTIQDAETGETIGTAAVTGTQAGVDDLISRANAQLLSKLGVSDLSAKDIADVKAGWPTTEEALKDYSAAMVLLHKGDAQGARDLLLKADAAESGVALIQAGLSDAWLELGYDKKAIAAASLALTYGKGLPEQELGSIQAQANVLQGNLPQAIDLYRGLLMFNPDKLQFGLKLSETEAKAGQGKRALTDLAGLANLPPPLDEDPRIIMEQAEAYDALGDFPKIAETAQHAQAGAAAIGARLLEAKADVKLCWAQRNLGHRDLAIAACQQANDIYQRVDDKLGEARAQTGLGNTLSDGSDYAGALAKYHTAADLTEGIGARGDRAGALLNSARMQIYLDRPAEAKVSLDELTSLAIEVGNSDTLAKAYFFRADIAHNSGDMAKAQEYIAEVLKIAEDQGHKDSIARAYSFQATYGLEAGNLAGALAGADKCIEIRTEITLLTGVAACQKIRGDILLAQNRIPEAQTAYKAAAQDFEDIREPLHGAEVWIAQSELSTESGSPADGEPLARNASLKFVKDVDMQASALSALLNSLVGQDKRTEAAQTWQALERLHPEDPDSQRDVEMAEARYRAMLGTFDLALTRAGQARDSCKQSGRIDCELQARLLNDEIRLQAGKTEGLDAEVQALVGDASRLGFALIAEKAEKTLASQGFRSARQ